MRLLRIASPLLAGGSSKLARGIRGRLHAGRSLSEWARIHRESSRPLVWCHAPSVGEGLQARAVLEALLHLRPSVQGAFTFFSPSAVPLAEKMPVHVASFLPWDVRSEMAEILELLRPDVVAFTKTEVWPGLAAAAADRDVPVVLVAATLPPDAGRLTPVARWFLAETFAGLDRVMAIAPEDGERFTRLGVDPARIEITGDPGMDSAWKRARDADPAAPYLAPFRLNGDPILVAGSTWPADEAVLVPAVAGVRAKHPALRTVIAPHEPTSPHLQSLERALIDEGFRVARLGEIEARGELRDVDAVVVDRVGVLAHLYVVGDLAYVGGGFHDDGLHSVLEPAAAGIPAAFGPKHQNSRAATDLAELGGAAVVEDAAGLEAVFGRWLDDPSHREEIGRLASGYVKQHRGAAMRTAKALTEYLPVEPI